MTDEQLMTHFQQGDQSAFQILFEKYRDKIFRFIYNGYDKNLSHVEDFTQDVFIKVIRNRNQFDVSKKFSTWLYAIARNHCLNRLASLSYRFEIKSFELLENDDFRDRTQNRLEMDEMSQVIHDKLTELSEEQRIVFIMREMDDCSFKEIADVLELNESTTRSHYSRGKKQLQKLLKPYIEG